MCAGKRCSVTSWGRSDLSGPLVSVVLPVRNGEIFIRDALDSIRHQTLEQWELIVVDDGSTDGTLELVKAVPDSRIRIIRNSGAGLASSLNAGIQVARAQHIARLDADDTASPERLELQLAFLDSSPGVVLVGGSMRVVTEQLNHIYTQHVPTSQAVIRGTLSQGQSPFMHPSVVFRRDAAVEVGLYSEGLDGCGGEDTEFFRRLITRGDLANLPDVVGEYRITRGAITTAISAMPRAAVRKRSRAIDRVLAGSANSEDLRFLRDFLVRAHGVSPEYAYHLRVGKAYRDYAGDLSSARRHLLSALRQKPTSIKAGYNLVRTCIPLLRRGADSTPERDSTRDRAN